MNPAAASLPAAAPALEPKAEISAASTADLRAWELIRRLVAFDTTSRESNLALIDWVAAYLRSHGIESMLTFDDERRKANLFATLPAQDGNVSHGGMVLSGHTDVVPVDGQPWTSNPFEVVVIADRAYGRGVTDMKSFIATGLAFVPEILRRGLRRPLHFALSYDEEVGCIGVHRLIDDVLRRGLKPGGCVVGEPTGMRVIVAHKGKQSFRCSVRGHAAHSALTPRGVNAVQVACDIVSYLTAMAKRFRDGDRHDDAYDVPYTTVHTGVIRGGTVLNIVPRDCQFEFEFRHLPFDDPAALLAEVKAYAESLLPEMQAVAPETFIRFEQLSSLPGFDTGADSDLARLGQTCSDTQDCGKVSFGTEASLFYQAAIPSIICGPGEIAQAHQPNEWVALDQLREGQAFMQRLAQALCHA